MSMPGSDWLSWGKKSPSSTSMAKADAKLPPPSSSFTPQPTQPTQTAATSGGYGTPSRDSAMPAGAGQNSYASQPASGYQTGGYNTGGGHPAAGSYPSTGGYGIAPASATPANFDQGGGNAGYAGTGYGAPVPSGHGSSTYGSSAPGGNTGYANTADARNNTYAPPNNMAPYGGSYNPPPTNSGGANWDNYGAPPTNYSAPGTYQGSATSTGGSIYNSPGGGANVSQPATGDAYANAYASGAANPNATTEAPAAGSDPEYRPGSTSRSTDYSSMSGVQPATFNGSSGFPSTSSPNTMYR